MSLSTYSRIYRREGFGLKGWRASELWVLGCSGQKKQHARKFGGHFFAKRRNPETPESNLALAFGSLHVYQPSCELLSRPKKIAM
jgi:hypothetical protein